MESLAGLSILPSLLNVLYGLFSKSAKKKGGVWGGYKFAAVIDNGKVGQAATKKGQRGHYYSWWNLSSEDHAGECI